VPRAGHTADRPDTVTAATTATARSTRVARQRGYVAVASQQRPGTRHRVSTANRYHIVIIIITIIVTKNNFINTLSSIIADGLH